MKALVGMLWAVALGGCSAVTADSPLTVTLGQPRTAAESDLRAHQYCRTSNEPPQREEIYPRCDRPGTEWGDSWVVAIYENEKLVELRRWERYADEAHALERWNQLVDDRSKLTPASEEAARALRDRGLLQVGTKSVRAFRVDGKTIVGVYLLTPSPPENAMLLEKIAFIGPDAVPAK